MKEISRRYISGDWRVAVSEKLSSEIPPLAPGSEFRLPMNLYNPNMTSTQGLDVVARQHGCSVSCEKEAGVVVTAVFKKNYQISIGRRGLNESQARH